MHLIVHSWITRLLGSALPMCFILSCFAIFWHLVDQKIIRLINDETKFCLGVCWSLLLIYCKYQDKLQMACIPGSRQQCLPVYTVFLVFPNPRSPPQLSVCFCVTASRLLAPHHTCQQSSHQQQCKNPGLPVTCCQIAALASAVLDPWALCNSYECCIYMQRSAFAYICSPILISPEPSPPSASTLLTTTWALIEPP